MRGTSITQVLMQLLAASSSIVAMPSNTNSSSDDLWSSSDHCDRATSSEGNVDVETANERRGFTGLFVISACLGIFSFIRDTVEEMRDKSRGERHGGSSIILQIANQPPWDAAGKSDHQKDDTNGKLPAA
jgi:hypothetical protein